MEGGEPFLRRDGDCDLRDIVAEAKKLFYSVGVTTNGTFPIEIDSDIVWISIDGLQETHDRIRGKSFARIMAHLDAAVHPRMHAHVTTNALNWEEVPALVAHLSPKVRGVTVQFHYPFQEVDKGLLLPWDKRREVLDNLIGLKVEGLPVANSYASLEALKENRRRCRPLSQMHPRGSHRWPYCRSRLVTWGHSIVGCTTISPSKSRPPGGMGSTLCVSRCKGTTREGMCRG